MSASAVPAASAGKPWRAALVVGSGVAGLLAARVLSDVFETVTVLERDAEPGDPAPRAGAPQGFHPHALLRRGQLVMERLFPGFVDSIVVMGAVPVDQGSEAQIAVGGRRGVAFDAPYKTLSMTRGLLELCLRRHVAAVPNISIRYGADAQELLFDGPARKATGVAARIGEAQQSFAADLVVDATGRAAQAMKWLTSAGFRAPRETAIGLDFGYATALFDIPKDFDGGWKVMFLIPKPPHEAVAGTAFEVEGNRWMVAIAGRGAQRPTADPEAFVPFAKGLSDQRLYQWIARARRVSEVKTYRFAASTRRHYERLENHPEGFLAIGDALCSFNPVYGQGMSVAAMEAEVLSELLSARAGAGTELSGLWREFYPRCAKAIDVPWTMARDLDMQYEQTKIPRPLLYPLTRALINWANRFLLSEPKLRAKLFATMNLVATPAEAITLGDLLGAQWRAWFSRP